MFGPEIYLRNTVSVALLASRLFITAPSLVAAMGLVFTVETWQSVIGVDNDISEAGGTGSQMFNHSRVPIKICGMRTLTSPSQVLWSLCTLLYMYLVIKEHAHLNK